MPSNAGDLIGRYIAWQSRTEPGPGINARDEGEGGAASLKSKSIPNVSTGRLVRRREHFHQALHTAQGLHDFDAPRRSLVEQGVHTRLISQELALRGMPRSGCMFCEGE